MTDSRSRTVLLAGGVLFVLVAMVIASLKLVGHPFTSWEYATVGGFAVAVFGMALASRLPSTTGRRGTVDRPEPAHDLWW